MEIICKTLLVRKASSRLSTCERGTTGLEYVLMVGCLCSTILLTTGAVCDATGTLALRFDAALRGSGAMTDGGGTSTSGDEVNDEFACDKSKGRNPKGCHGA